MERNGKWVTAWDWRERECKNPFSVISTAPCCQFAAARAPCCIYVHFKEWYTWTNWQSGRRRLLGADNERTVSRLVSGVRRLNDGGWWYSDCLWSQEALVDDGRRFRRLLVVAERDAAQVQIKVGERILKTVKNAKSAAELKYKLK